MARPRKKFQDSPITNKQKALAEQEAKLREAMEQAQRVISDAPARKKEFEKRKKEDLVIRASQPTRRAESPGSLFDKRYDLVAAPTRRRTKSLRAERQAERMKFFALCALLTVALWALFHWWPR